MTIFQSIKRLIKHSAVYGLGHILNRSIGFILLPVYTNVFSADAFGIVGMMITYLTISTLLYCYGLDAGFMRYYVLAESRERRRAIFASAFIALACSSLLFSGLIVVFSTDLSQILFSFHSMNLGIDLSLLLRLLAGILFCDTVAFIPLLALRAEERSWLFISIKTINGVINLGANILFIIFWHMGVEGIFYANLLSSAVTLLMILPIMMQRGLLRFSWRMLREQLLFGLPFLLSGCAIAVMDSVDRIFLERLQSVQMAGVYNAGAKLGMVMGLFVAAFRFAWHPYFLATSKQADAKEIFSKIFTYLVLSCFTLLLLIHFFIDDLVQLKLFGRTFFAPEFWGSISVVSIIMLAYVFYAFYLVFEASLYLHKKSLLIALITLGGMVINLLANHFLVPTTGMLGAAWARALAYFSMAAGLLYYSQKYYPIPYEWQRLGRLTFITILMVVAHKWLIADIGWLAQVGLFLALPAILYSTGFFTKTEKARLKATVKNIFGKHSDA